MMDKRLAGKTEAEITAMADETRRLIAVLDLLANSPQLAERNSGFGDAYKHVGVNFSLAACEFAADVTGYDRTLCKMFNYEFRTAAAELMFERALADVAQPLAA